jgi:hypothetical protein
LEAQVKPHIPFAQPPVEGTSIDRDPIEIIGADINFLYLVDPHDRQTISSVISFPL